MVQRRGHGQALRDPVRIGVHRLPGEERRSLGTDTIPGHPVADAVELEQCERALIHGRSGARSRRSASTLR